MQEDGHLCALTACMIYGLPSSRAEAKQETPPYWPFYDHMVVGYGIVTKGRRIVVSVPLQQRALEQLHINHMDIEKVRLLPRKFTYWLNINADIENTINSCTTCLYSQATQLKDKLIPYNVPGKLWEL